MKTLVKDLNSRANDNGVKNLLIMISQEGELASSRKNLRAMAIDKHKAWIDVANEIGCESVRVDLRGSFPVHALLDFGFYYIHILGEHRVQIEHTYRFGI